MIALLMALQETPAHMDSPALLHIDFDLAKAQPASAAPGDIVVVGRRTDRRLPVLPDVREDLLPKAQTGLFGGTASIAGETRELPGGFTSKRIMLKWKLAF